MYFGLKIHEQGKIQGMSQNTKTDPNVNSEKTIKAK